MLSGMISLSKDIIVLMRDTGMRNARELYRMRVENIDWNSRVIFNHPFLITCG